MSDKNAQGPRPISRPGRREDRTAAPEANGPRELEGGRTEPAQVDRRLIRFWKELTVAIEEKRD